jgi:hypothetical protein
VIFRHQIVLGRHGGNRLSGKIPRPMTVYAPGNNQTYRGNVPGRK